MANEPDEGVPLGSMRARTFCNVLYWLILRGAVEVRINEKVCLGEMLDAPIGVRFGHPDLVLKTLRYIIARTGSIRQRAGK